MKKVKNQKGFTLIELIVVIAILGILALIAVPRLAGFTNKAKVSNDKELASIVAHSIQTAVAAGDIKVTADAEVTIKNNGTDLSYSVTSGSMTDDKDAAITDLHALLNPLVGTKKFQFINSAVIKVTTTGDAPISQITYDIPTL